MLRLLHLADVHIGAPLGGFGDHAEERGRQILDAVRRLPELAAATEVSAILVAGDLFDSPRPTEGAVAAVGEVARRLREAGIPLFAVPGNHDAYSLNPPLYEEALRDAHVFSDPVFGEPICVEVGGEELHVYGVAYDPAEEPDPLAGHRRAEAPGWHVVLLHGSVPGAPHWEGGSSLRLTWERLAGLHADYIALGDHHRFRPPEEFEKHGVPACYSGSFAAVDVTETGPHGAAVVELEAGRPPRVSLVSSGVPPVVQVGELDVSSLEDEIAVAEAVGEGVAEPAVPVVRLVGAPSYPLDAEKVRAWLTERYGCAAVEDDTRYYASERLSELARGKTVASHVARLGAARVLEAGDAEERRIAEEGLRIALRAMGVR